MTVAGPSWSAPLVSATGSDPPPPAPSAAFVVGVLLASGHLATCHLLAISHFEAGAALIFAWVQGILVHLAVGGGAVVLVAGALGLAGRATPVLRGRERRLALATVLGTLLMLDVGVKLGPYLPGDRWELPSLAVYPTLLVAAVALAGLFLRLAEVLAGAVPRRLHRAGILATLAIVLVAGLPLARPGTFATPDAAQAVQLEKRAGATPRRLLLVGVDGLDWEIVDALTARGELPALRALVRGGLRGYHQPVHYYSPVVWTSMVTGQPSAMHGVHDFIAYQMPGAERPIMVDNDREFLYVRALRLLARMGAGIDRRVPMDLRYRRAPALWNVASAAGRRVAVVGWILARHAESVEGFFVSPDLIRLAWTRSRADRRAEDETGRVHPPNAISLVRSTVEELRATEPSLRGQGARDRAATEIAARLIHRDPGLDLVMVYWRDTDDRAHHWADAMRAGDPEGARDRWEALLVSYRNVDRMLGKLVESIGHGWAVMVVSDHGWRLDKRRPGHHGFPPPEGIFVLGGRHGLEVPPAPWLVSTYDVAPTALALLGLPISARMPGEVAPVPLRATARRVPAYQFEVGWSTPSLGTGPALPDPERMEELRALGYVR